MLYIKIPLSDKKKCEPAKEAEVGEVVGGIMSDLWEAIIAALKYNQWWKWENKVKNVKTL